MKKIDTKNCLCIYDEGELESVYITTGTVNDIIRILGDSGYFDYSKNDWANGIYGYCSLIEIANKILENYEVECDDIFIGINGHAPWTRY